MARRFRAWTARELLAKCTTRLDQVRQARRVLKAQLERVYTLQGGDVLELLQDASFGKLTAELQEVERKLASEWHVRKHLRALVRRIA